MNDELKAYIQEQVAHAVNVSRFNLTPISSHTHDGTNAPAIPEKNIISSPHTLGNVTMALAHQVYTFKLNQNFNPTQVIFLGGAYKTNPSGSIIARATVQGQAFLEPNQYLQTDPQLPLTSQIGGIVQSGIGSGLGYPSSLQTTATPIQVSSGFYVAGTSGSGTIYAGLVNSDGTAGSFFPSGWSSTKTSDPGRYKITHNLGTTSYAFASTNASGSGDTSVCSATLNTNDVSYSMDVPGSGFENAPLSFILSTSTASTGGSTEVHLTPTEDHIVEVRVNNNADGSGIVARATVLGYNNGNLTVYTDYLANDSTGFWTIQGNWIII